MGSDIFIIYSVNIEEKRDLLLINCCDMDGGKC